MLTTTDRDALVEDLMEEMQLSTEARAIVRHVRKQNPSRVTRSGTHNVATRYASRKMGCVIQAEAQTTELAAVYEWDHDDITVEFYDQPPTIKKIGIKPSGKNFAYAYTPDYFLVQRNFIGWVECKRAEELKKLSAQDPDKYLLDDNGNWRCPPAERYAESVGLKFQIRSSHEVDVIITKNLGDFSDYCDPSCPEPPEKEAGVVRALFRDSPFLCLQDLLELAPAVTADTIYTMIASEELFVDMRSTIVMDEPHTTRVFRSLAAWEASRLYLTEQGKPSEFSLKPVQVAPGETLHWNGNDWRVANVTDTHISLVDEAGNCSTLKRDSFFDQIGKGEILGCGRSEDSRQDVANKIMSSASPKQMEVALERYYALFPEQAPHPVKSYSKRALRYIRNAYDESERTYNRGFIGLIPRFDERGNRQEKVAPEARKAVGDILEELLKRKSKVFVPEIHGELRLRCKELGVVAPSEKTVRAIVRCLKSPHSLEQAGAGRKAAYRFEAPYLLERATPKHGTRPFEIGHIDHTELDLQFVDREFGRNMGKACLTILMDAYDREILAWYLSFDPPSYRALMMVIRKCVRRHHRIPATIVTDNGDAFKGTYFQTLLAYLGSHQKLRPASKSRFGSVIERFFGINNTRFVHKLRGNNRALQEPRSMSKTHDPRKLAIWDLGAFDRAFELFLANFYHVVDHPALGVSPLAARAVGLAQSGMRAHKHFPYTAEFEVLTMPSTAKGYSAVQKDGGIQLEYLKYYHPALSEPRNIGKSFAVRYDPFDISRAFVHVGHEWLMCRCKYASLFKGRSLKEIETLSEEIRDRNKAGSRKRNVNLEVLAQEMRWVREKEAQMMIGAQRLRDLERMASDGLGLIDADAIPEDATELEALDGNPQFTIETYGDFK